MRHLIDLVEATDPYLPLAKAIWRHTKANPDYYDVLSWGEFSYYYKDLMRVLQKPTIEVYRGMSWEEDHHDYYYDAREEEFEYFLERHPEHAQAILAQVSGIDFANIGTAWTSDWDKAVSGGADDHFGNSHCILSATVNIRQIDIPRTMYHNLARHPEESEIRLLPNIPVTITEISALPTDMVIPIQANTGRPDKDENDYMAAVALKDFPNA